MGKASRRKGDTKKSRPAPFVRRPFEGIEGETDLVAMREIVPAATATLRLREPAGEVSTATVCTVLPMAWPGLRRADGEVLVGLQSGSASSDASRDLAQVLLAATTTEPGNPVVALPLATAETPRLQDLLDTTAPLDLQVHEGFDFWVAQEDLDEEGKASLDRANESAIPTVKLDGVTSAYWCLIGERAYVRQVLPDDEDAATDALARLHARGESALTEGHRLLGAFRACGLLIPVWEVDPEAEPSSWADAVQDMQRRYAGALAAAEPLTTDERRARSGLLSRQITLR
ncbi:DUF5926 family protein [Arsenicicoccus sp. oral taxon 190]|uniref:DUF5926 family protein n=1 Tax=Arsenicicoccus sp. oral taxon 190 TaxID=1658671 RepID=UPI00067A2EA5|nr:DUF5926 family protein [Arsenicicoccus sp. oral taxon 190]AKT50634.1 topoisomerase II [Arsenicicoccus sp. oral taxon 190]